MVRPAPYLPTAGAETWATARLSPYVIGGATLAEVIDWMHGAPIAAGESYLYGTGGLYAVVTCPHCGGDYSQVDEDPGHPDWGGGSTTHYRCSVCDQGVVAVDELAYRTEPPGTWARDECCAGDFDF